MFSANLAVSISWTKIASSAVTYPLTSSLHCLDRRVATGEIKAATKRDTTIVRSWGRVSSEPKFSINLAVFSPRSKIESIFVVSVLTTSLWCHSHNTSLCGGRIMTASKGEKTTTQNWIYASRETQFSTHHAVFGSWTKIASTSVPDPGSTWIFLTWNNPSHHASSRVWSCLNFFARFCLQFPCFTQFFIVGHFKLLIFQVFVQPWICQYSSFRLFKSKLNSVWTSSFDEIQIGSFNFP